MLVTWYPGPNEAAVSGRIQWRVEGLEEIRGRGCLTWLLRRIGDRTGEFARLF
jgi:hypothetical protein